MVSGLGAKATSANEAAISAQSTTTEIHARTLLIRSSSFTSSLLSALRQPEVDTVLMLMPVLRPLARRRRQTGGRRGYDRAALQPRAASPDSTPGPTDRSGTRPPPAPAVRPPARSARA